MDSGQQPSSEDSRPSSTGSTDQAQSSTPPVPGTTTKKEKGRVRFNSTADVEPPPPAVLQQWSIAKDPHDPTSQLKPKPRPSLIRGSSYNSVLDFRDEDDEHDPRSEVAMSARAAQERAQHVAATVLGSHSAPGSRRNSIDSDNETLHEEREDHEDHEDHPAPSRRRSSRLHDLALKLANSQLTGHGDNQEIDHERRSSEQRRAFKKEAYNLVQSHTQSHPLHNRHFDFEQPPPSIIANSSGQVTPTEERDAELWVPPPQQFRGTVLSQLLKLYRQRDDQPPSYPQSQRSDFSETTTPGSSGTATPTRRKWYDKNRSTDTLANLVEASARLANVNTGAESPASEMQSKRPKRPKYKRSPSSRLLKLGRPRIEDEIRITINIAETLSRQRYIIKMCKALMMYGAPTHRLEEYLTMTARVLEIDGQFLYLPGCMIISFDDKQTHTTEVKIVRSAQGIDLGKLKDIHEIYKSVLHDLYGVDEAIDRIATIMAAKDKFPPWLRVLVFGLASSAVAPFAFGGRWIDLPICFLLGSMVGALQIIVAPKSALYNNLFEISATILTSFLARAFGSIRGGNLFCFSALAQSSIALILPGWFVLSSALELQSRALVPGSIRLVYAIIYSLFLGFGITVGTVLYGIADSNATSATTCSNTMNPHLAFVFVPLFTICLAVVNQAKWKQLPAMVLISFAGYLVNFFSSPKFRAAPQIANTLGAFTVGVAANLYSRLRHGVAVTALLPAIFVQVPSGLAATGSLLSGLNAANQINNNSQPVNGTSTVPVDNGISNMNDVVYNVAGSMIQIAIGITLGLFLSAFIIYPLGKRRSGLWTL
ncbi:hypothetical protein GQX73_g10367 [Xylaria multiplex]|uniref:Threonine/serine exporter-like N-terminal domain-containing protein n=1 Tax=Xylaria multiplex TaxID=323545 RepID=A0A7C8IGN3_9PEZI|nr:hypothetical protein GQX73_g10367 [Xylaria multiplex]